MSEEQIKPTIDPAEAEKKEDERSIWQSALIIGVGALVAIVLLALLALIVAGYVYDLERVGVSDKTVWDWLELFIIPAVLAIGLTLFNSARERAEDKRLDAQKQAEKERAKDLTLATALQAYLDDMGKLILDHGLGTEPEDEERARHVDRVRSLARAKTIPILRILSEDAVRRQIVAEFLSNASLFSDGGIDLAGAELSGVNLIRANLQYAQLYRANLEGAKLVGANLKGASLVDANLEGASLQLANLERVYLISANLERAYLLGANLKGAELREAKLEGAHLRRTNLSGADLRRANLRQADLSGADLSEVKFEGAILPDGTKWSPDVDMERFTNPGGEDRVEVES